MYEAGGRLRIIEQTWLARCEKREAWGKTGSSWRSFASLRTVA